MTAALFQPLPLRGLTLNNRVIVSPMCQYSAEDGLPTDWHMIHIGGLAMAGTGMLVIEAVGVEPRGRVTPQCLGLYDDATEAALKRIIDACQQHGNTPVALQLGHAGRKASCHAPQNGGRPLAEDEGAWPTIGPSAVPFGPDWHTPAEMTRSDMDDVIAAHVQATERAHRVGFAALEIHGAHGYLLSSFLSPLANRRGDAYGGDNAGRMRFPLELFATVRAAWPADKPLGMRLNGTDWDDAGLSNEDAIAFARALKDLGCDFFDVTGGGNSMVRPPLKPGYQAPFAQTIKQATGVPTMAVGMIRDPQIAEDLITTGQCDMVAIARGFLYEPRWTWRAAHELGAEGQYPPQYARANPKLWPQAFSDADDDPNITWEPGAAPHIMVPKRS